MVDRRSTALILLALLPTVACDDESSPTGPEPEVPAAAAIFADEYAEDVTFQAFSDSKFDAVQVDETVAYEGAASLRVTVPGPEDASGFFAGGAFTSSTPWDLSQYDVLTFWARADRNATINVAGLGNDNTGTSRYMVETTELDISGVWRKYVVPMPDPSVMSSEAGLFYFAEGHENGEGYTIWFDNIQFEDVDAALVRAGMDGRTITIEPGNTDQVTGLTATVDVNGVEATVSPMPLYYTFSSSDPAVASVSEDGTITAGEVGTAVITAMLGDLPAGGSVTVTSGTPLSEPAPTPTRPAADVISLYSDVYDDVTVDTWSAVWDNAGLEDTQVAGDNLKLYTNLVFAGIEFTSETIDATQMDGFHMDIWTPDGAPGEVFKIKLVDFGADGAWSGGDDVEHEISITAPTLASKEWVGIDVPLSDFANMTTRGHVAQLIISGDPNTVYVDNVYFFKGEAQGGGGEPVTEPAIPAPAPEEDAADVISLYSGAYTDVTVDSWNTSWSSATYEEIQVAGDDVKKYSGLDFNGIETTSAMVDASGMTHLSMDIWTPDATRFSIKLVDFGADGAYGGGDDSEHQIDFDDTTTPALATGEWVSLDIPLSDFTGLTARAHLAQYIIVGQPTGATTVFLDNVYFFDASAAAPSVAAPAPAQDAADVISLFSGAYTDVTVDSWNTSWSSATYEEVQVAGDDVKKYSGLDFNGIETTSAMVDASGMTHLSMDIWTPDATQFSVKLVDFGADGAYGGGDDSEHQVDFNSGTTPALGTGQWVSLDIPLSDFTGLAARAHLAQYIIVGQPTGEATVFLDNVYFYNEVAAPTEPATAAPTPTHADADVISLFSDAYTDVTVDTWSASWDDADVEDVTVSGDAVKKYTNLVFAGIEFTSQVVDASEMTHLRFDFWTPDAVDGGEAFKVKLVDFGADGAWSGGDDVEHEITLDNGYATPLATGTWVSFDIPLSEFTDLTTRASLAQLIISGDLGTVFLDNLYLRK